MIFLISLVAFGAFLVGSMSQGIYCHFTAVDFILHEVNYGNNAGDCAAGGSAWGLMLLVPSILFIHLPILFVLRSVLEGVRPAILFVLLPAVPYALLVWLLLGWDFLPVLGVSSLIFGLGSQMVMATYDRKTAKLDEEKMEKRGEILHDMESDDKQ